MYAQQSADFKLQNVSGLRCQSRSSSSTEKQNKSKQNHVKKRLGRSSGILASLTKLTPAGNEQHGLKLNVSKKWVEWEGKEINKRSTGLCPADVIYKSRVTLISRILSVT